MQSQKPISYVLILAILCHKVDMGNIYFCSRADINCSRADINCFISLKNPKRKYWHVFCLLK